MYLTGLCAWHCKCLPCSNLQLCLIRNFFRGPHTPRHMVFEPSGSLATMPLPAARSILSEAEWVPRPASVITSAVAKKMDNSHVRLVKWPA